MIHVLYFRKPTAFATLNFNGKLRYYFGLPGNPVSCSVTSILIVIPTLKYLERSKVYHWPKLSVKVCIVIKIVSKHRIKYFKGNLTNEDDRPEYHRVLVKIHASDNISLTSTGNQISSRLNSMVGANGLAIVNKNIPSFSYSSAGDLTVLLFDNLV